MKKLSTYKKQKIAQNLDHFYTKADKDQRANGLRWYQEAHEIVQGLAKKYNFDPLVVANVLSALSPRNKWDRNIKDTEAVLKAVRSGQGPETISVCTFNNNKQKAFDLARGDRQGIKFDKSPKTHSFVRNIAHLDADFVTVDVWHTRAAFDRMIVPSNLSLSNYEDIVAITKRNAKKHNVTPYQYQAVVWCSIRD